MDLERNIIKVVLENHSSIVFVAKTITRRIVHYTRMEGHKSIVLRRHRQLKMLVKSSLKSMQHLITGRQIIRHPLLRWNVSSVIELFPFLLVLDIIIVMFVLT